MIDGDLAETVYTHLRAIAQLQMNGERSSHTLSATALVHEAYMRLATHPAASGGVPKDKSTAEYAAFVRAAAEAMRRVLVEHGRARGRLKRGGKEGGGRAERVPLELIGDVGDLSDDAQCEFAESLDGAFRKLEAHDERFADVVRLRFYAGLSVEETARVLGVSERTVQVDWAYARAWLARELQRRSEA